jgi:hypothetical protein
MRRRKVRTISRVVPPEIKDEPRSEPPYLNPTAHWYTQDAWNLFHEIAQRCELPTAKFIFQKCISVAEEQENQAAKIAKEKATRRTRASIKLPTAEQIAAADRKRICNWWAQLRRTDQKFNAQEKRVIDLLWRRYVDVDGYPEGFNENLRPTKKRGSVKRKAPNRELPALFDSSNPDSAFSIEKAKRGGKLTQAEFAATLVPTYGHDAEHVLANLRYHRRPKI